ncbi:MAG: hypothetical protein ACI4W6_06575 [Acutalibacteraceae bacterium]
MEKSKKSNIKAAIGYFAAAFSVTSLIYLLFQFYDEFLTQTAGSYFIAYIAGETLSDFLLQLLTAVVGVILFVFVLLKAKRKNKKTLYPIFLIIGGVLAAILPGISHYTVSRFTGALLSQTVTGIAIIANVVFTMLCICFLCLTVTDMIFSLLSQPKEHQGVSAAMTVAGVPFAIGLASLLSTIITASQGLNTVFVLFGVLGAIIGIVLSILKIGDCHE